MHNPTAEAVLQREFLTTRCLLVDLAAALDRVDRAEGPVADDPRWATIRRSLGILAEESDGRARRVQEAFSLPYDAHWRM